MRVFGVPKQRLRNLHLDQLLLNKARRRVALHLHAALIDLLSVGVCDTYLHRHLLVAASHIHLGSNRNEAVVAGGDAQWMALKEQVAVSGNEFHITKESTTSVPTRVARLAGVGHYSDHIVLTKPQGIGHINLEAHITIVGAPYLLSVHIDITHIHDAPEVEHQATTTQTVGRCQVQTIPASAHLLEATTRQSTLDISSGIVVVGLLASSRCHPRLLYLEIVRQVDHTPRLVVETFLRSIRHITSMKLPSEVQQLNRALSLHLHSTKQQGRKKSQGCRCSHHFSH